MKKTNFNKNVPNITYKPDTCLNSGELEGGEGRLGEFKRIGDVRLQCGY